MSLELAGKVVVFNGPPRSGKDTLAAFIRGATQAKPMEFKRKLIELALMISGVSPSDWEFWYQQDKEEPHNDLGGHSCRSFLIMVSEEMIKPHMGGDYFGLAAATELEMYLPGHGVVFTDSGFPAELQCVVNVAGAENVIVVQLMRDGTDFSGDSRAYLSVDDFPSVKFIALRNNGPAEEVAALLMMRLHVLLGSASNPHNRNRVNAGDDDMNNEFDLVDNSGGVSGAGDNDATTGVCLN